MRERCLSPYDADLVFDERPLTLDDLAAEQVELPTDDVYGDVAANCEAVPWWAAPAQIADYLERGVLS